MNTGISIIVCTYNRDPYIYRTLEHIATNGFPTDSYEIVLVNNNSTDRTEKECRRFEADFPRVNFRYFVETRQGLSFARNRGIRESVNEVLLFLDDDAFMQENYLRNLTANVERYPEAAAFGGKITPLYESGIAPQWISKWTYSWVSAIDKGPVVCLFTGNSYPIGANMGFRRSCFQYGDFNTELGRSKGNLMGGEEKDIFNHLKAQNLKIYYFPDVEVQHVIPEKRTTQEYIRQFALGIGRSERLRTLKISRTSYLKRLFSEAVKWGASCVLCLGYALKFTPQKGTVLIYFRWYVTKGLLQKNPVVK